MPNFMLSSQFEASNYIAGRLEKSEKIAFLATIFRCHLSPEIFIGNCLSGKKPERRCLSYGFFRSGEKIEFPFSLEDGSGIFGLLGTIMGPSMGPMPTSSQLIQPTLCKISNLSDSQFSGYIPLSRKHPNMQMSFSCENPHFSTDLVEICFIFFFLKKKNFL